jgi:hypothetical protein
MHAIVIGEGAQPQDMSGCWLEDGSLEGHAPLFDIKCMYHPKEPMMMRYSHITPKTLVISRLSDGRKNIIEYKCKICGKIEHFYVDASEEYLNQIKHKRIVEGYRDLYYPHEKWNNDKIVKKRLKELGYF